MSNEIATFAGGCFWCLEAVFERLRGVNSAVSGYMGGHVAHPDYESVCQGDTGHAEVVQVAYDPRLIDFPALLDVFFTIHDPTQLNRQGNDVGTQYRSAVFWHTPAQKAAAGSAVAELNASGRWGAPVVTAVVEATVFYPAEAYHRHYFERNPQQPYCRYVVAPKVAKAEQTFAARLKD